MVPFSVGALANTMSPLPVVPFNRSVVAVSGTAEADRMSRNRNGRMLKYRIGDVLQTRHGA